MPLKEKERTETYSITITLIKNPCMHKTYTEGFCLHFKKMVLVRVINDHQVPCILPILYHQSNLLIALDTGNHCLLLNFLHLALGHRTVLSISLSLTGCSVLVSLFTCSYLFSQVLDVTVPQGSDLRPLPFSNYTHTLGYLIQTHDFK